MKNPINMTAGDLVNHLRGYSQSTPVKIKGNGTAGFLSYEDGAVVVELSEPASDNPPGPYVYRPRLVKWDETPSENALDGGDAA